MGDDVILYAENIGKVIGTRRILGPLSLTVRSRRLLVVTGPNGAGKSSLLRMLAGVWSYTEGQLIRFGGHVARDGGGDLRIGYLSHDSFLTAHLSLWENLRLYAGLWRLRDIRKRIDEVVSFVGLGWCAHDPIYLYSQGMRQRAEWARIMLTAPQLLLLDEPLNALDEGIRGRLSEWVASQRTFGATVIVTAHQVDEWAEHADAVAVLRAGQWQSWETAEEWRKRATTLRDA
ncbi:MAG: ABC transporter ATP-binding protein [Firmicutes bacterium]|nr:ABC transporter ATP-binding protein [Bacillota bacterium]